jgi:hypothetical protein
MGQVFDSIDDGIRAFIGEQHMFFVATAPSDGGHVNLSPKGLDTFRVLDEHRVGYLDLTGSGAETIAHLRDNGRITLMFCAFDGRPRIVRLAGRGSFVVTGDDGYDELAAQFPDVPGARAVITVDVDRVADSCGFAVPTYDYVGDRDVLNRWAARHTADELDDYRRNVNTTSIDGLPALWEPADSP